jgi:putative protease
MRITSKGKIINVISDILRIEMCMLSEKKLNEVGVVTHYYSRLSVAIVELTDILTIGDEILIRSGMDPFTTNFEQTVKSMQIEHTNITSAQSGQSIGLKVDKKVREGDKVYKLT